MSKTTKTTKTTTRSFSWSKFFKFISFIAVIMVALSLIFSKIIPSIGNALQTIGNVLAYIIVLVSSFHFVIYKRNIWYFVAWVVSCILIVVYFII